MELPSVLTGLLVFGVSLVVLDRQPEIEDASSRPSDFIPNEAEASVSLEWTTDPAHAEQWRQYTETNSLDVRALAIGGDWSWVETAAELQDWFFVAEKQRECSMMYGGTIRGVCSYTISYVALGDGAGRGTIVYASSALRDESSIPPASSANDPRCHDYIGCLARARLGVVIPLPAATRPAMTAIHEHLQSHWGDPVLFDLERLPKLIDSWARYRDFMAEQGRRGELTEAHDVLKLRSVESLVPYLRGHQRRLQEAADGGP
ncbi:hypothetical protein [Paraliomyxa miuraensis]|uniref:hypothetical protein n=1 Tax=Paraliomyxa miuraensis TaxID=376150 RepID=UPI00224CE286|nr:hypothetical protein [Paraliomyxa miuraensis]MCX4240746.1 hypothetical protein [Paraliomyxa miuraensis]